MCSYAREWEENSCLKSHGSTKERNIEKVRELQARRNALTYRRSLSAAGTGASLVAKAPAISSLKVLVFLYLSISPASRDDPFKPVSGLDLLQSCSRSPESCCLAATSIPFIPRRRNRRRHHIIDRVPLHHRLVPMQWSLMARFDIIMGVFDGQM